MDDELVGHNTQGTNSFHAVDMSPPCMDTDEEQNQGLKKKQLQLLILLQLFFFDHSTSSGTLSPSLGDP